MTAPARFFAMVLIATGALGLAACGSSSSSANPGPISVAPDGSGSAATPGAADADVTLAGTNGVAGPVSNGAVSCSYPSLDGVSINVLGSPATTGQSTMINVTAGKVSIRLDEGSGAAYRERDFTGTGVTGFDATRGAHIDSPVTEVMGTTTKKGDLGAITSITGTISCGTQSAGSSTIVVTGDPGDGPITGVLGEPHVTCSTTAQGVNVTILGVVKSGTTPVLLLISAHTAAFTVSASTKSAYLGLFSAAGANASNLTTLGAQLDGNATTVAAAGHPARTLHVVGAASCGTG